MKKAGKTRLAVASLGLVSSVGAYAADGVSFYALIDGGVASSNISGKSLPTPSSKTEFVTGGYAPTFAGLKYEKAIEGGIVAGAQLEQGFLLTPDNSGDRWGFGNGNILNRQANLYLKGSLGNLVVGTQPNIAFNTVLLGDPRFGSNYGSSLAMIDIGGKLNTVDDASISYTAPTFSGLTLAGQVVTQSKTTSVPAGVGFGQGPSGSGINHGARASATYTYEKFTGGLAYYTSTIPGTANSDPTKSISSSRDSGTILALTYKLEPVTLKFIGADQKVAATSSYDLKTWGLGAVYALGAKTTFDAGYYESKVDVGNIKTKTYAAGVQYKLTSNIALYGQLARVEAKGDAGTSAPFNFTWTTTLTNFLSAGQTASTANVGLLFSFF